MRGLALDLGGITGWAADDPDGGTVPLADIWDCSHVGSKLGPAFLKFEHHLLAAIRRLQPNYVCFEAAVVPRWGRTNINTSRKLLGLGAIVELTGERLGLPVYDVHLGSARRHFVGNARAQKSDIWHQCKLNGWPAMDLNATDAICVLVYARACFGQVQIMGKAL